MKYSVVQVDVKEYLNVIKISLDKQSSFNDLEDIVKKATNGIDLEPLFKKHKDHFFINSDFELVLDFKKDFKTVFIDMSDAFKYPESLFVFYEGFLEYMFK